MWASRLRVFARYLWCPEKAIVRQEQLPADPTHHPDVAIADMVLRWSDEPQALDELLPADLFVSLPDGPRRRTA